MAERTVIDPDPRHQDHVSENKETPAAVAVTNLLVTNLVVRNARTIIAFAVVHAVVTVVEVPQEWLQIAPFSKATGLLHQS